MFGAPSTLKPRLALHEKTISTLAFPRHHFGHQQQHAGLLLQRVIADDQNDDEGAQGLKLFFSIKASLYLPNRRCAKNEEALLTGMLEQKGCKRPSTLVLRHSFVFCFISCCCSRFQSFSFSASRLSCCFLPFAKPISSLMRPPL